MDRVPMLDLSEVGRRAVARRYGVTHPSSGEMNLAAARPPAHNDLHDLGTHRYARSTSQSPLAEA